jgi:hypothetical protein
MTEAMTPEREREIRLSDEAWARHDYAGAALPALDRRDLLAALDAEREARQRAEKLAADAAEDCSQWKRVALETQTELLDALSSAGLTAIATAIARAERAEAERDEALRKLSGYPPDSHPGIAWQDLNARADTAEAAYSALREAVDAVLGKNPHDPGSIDAHGNTVGGEAWTAHEAKVWAAMHSALASTPASLAASYRERVERETIERCAKECEAKAVDMRGLMHGLWLSSGADECAARLRSLASGKDPK